MVAELPLEIEMDNLDRIQTCQEKRAVTRSYKTRVNSQKKLIHMLPSRVFDWAFFSIFEGFLAFAL